MGSEVVAVLEIDGKQFALIAGRSYLVGRKSTADDASKLDIEFESQSVDTKHALIRVRDEEIKILDLYSKLGTFFNNQRLNGLTALTIGSTGQLQLGELVGSLQFNATLQSYNSSGFHDGPKNNSDIICSSPEPVTLSGSRLKHMQKNSLTSTPNCNGPGSINPDEINTQCNFLIPPVPQRKSNASNTSRASLTAETTLNSAANNSINQQNKNVDSFCIPETQQYPGRHSLDSNSSRDITLAVSNVGGDSLLNSRVSDDDQDFCIPETQEALPAFTNSQARNRFQAESAVLDANLPLSIFAEEDENAASSVSGSQFRICTQDFNEVDCFNDDCSNGSDLLADAPFSIVIPRIQHDAVMLNNSGKVVSTDDQMLSIHENVGQMINKEASTLPWPAPDSPLHNDALLHREGSCTPELFDLPDIAQELVNEANDIISAPCNEISNSNESKKVPVELPSTSFKTPTMPAIKVNNLALFEDEDDLVPTQVFSAKPGIDPKKVTTGKCSPEYLTLSDKENILPAAAGTMLEAVDFMQPTQIFNFSGGSDDDPLLVPIATTSTTVTPITTIKEIEPTKNNASITIANPQVPTEDDDDLQPTQVFPSAKPNTTVDAKTSTANIKFLSSTLKTTGDANEIPDSSTSFVKMNEQNLPVTASVVDFRKPPESLKKKTSAPLDVSLSESPDIDLLLCTPQIIAENFVKSDAKVKLSILDKQKTLFGDDSDESDDVLELISAPKVSRDFDKLLPHLRKSNQSPNREEMEAKLQRYNRSFGDKGDSNDSKSKEDQRRRTRNREERHLERDKQRETRSEKPVKSKKNDEESKKQTASKASTRREAAKIEEKKDKVSKSERKRKHSDSETAEKIGQKLEKDKNKNEKAAEKTKRGIQDKDKDKNKDEQKKQQKPVNAVSKEAKESIEISTNIVKRQEKITKKDGGNSAEKERVPKVKLLRMDEKKTNRELQNLKGDNVGKLNEAEKAGSLAAITTRRKTRSRTQSQSSNGETPVELPPRRLTRLKSRIEGEQIDEKSSATAEPRKASRTNKKKDNEDRREQDVTPKELAAKKKKLISSSSQSSCISSISSNQEEKSYDASKSDKAITATQERRKRLRCTTTTVSATHASSSTSTPTTTTTTPADKTNVQNLRKPKKIQVSMTMVDPEHFQNLARNASDIWAVAKDPVESDILIMDKGNRTFKFLIAMAKGIPVVTSSWLEMVNKSRQIISMTEHLYADELFEKRHKFSLLKSLQMARKHKLFADYHFILTPGIRPQPNEMEAIIKCAGGSIHADVPAIKDNQKLYLVTSKEDQKLWHKYRRLNSKICIISSEGVMAAVMRQVVKPLETNLLA